MRYLAFCAALFLILLLVVGLRSERFAVAHDQTTLERFDYQQDPRETPCPRDLPVLLVVGQSNAANYGDAPHTGSAHINFYEGRCYPARDPLLGASGDRAAVWTRLGGGPYLIAPVAKGGSLMWHWRPGGPLFPRLERTLGQLRAAGLDPDHVLVVQGESEGSSGHDPEGYERAAVRLLTYLRATGATIWFATTSRCRSAPNASIRLAQERARRATGTLAGPDLDRIPDRANICHFGPGGLHRIASEWTARLGHGARLEAHQKPERKLATFRPRSPTA